MRVFLHAARGTADWIASLAIRTDHGLTWPTIEGQLDGQSAPVRGPADLYAGGAGIALMYIEANRTTSEPRYLELAQAAGRYLAGVAPEVGANPGLYTGLTGMAFALNELARATGDHEDADAARSVLDLLCDTASVSGEGVQWEQVWNGRRWSSTDIIGGIAGAALTLAMLGLELGHERSIITARAAGRRLTETAEPAEGGLRWGAAVGPIEKYMPNFSHGTAGIAYALATLGEWLGEDRFLDAALRGASHLLAVAEPESDTFKVFHYTPGGESSFPLGWCHGPTGLIRLFRRLQLATDDESWFRYVERCARTVRTSGIPERKFPGFWDNVSLCCGSTRVAETFLDLHRITGDPDALAFARTMTDDILARAISDDRGTRWSNYEYRKDPPDLPPSTGFMQGSSGIATWLFRFHRYMKGDETHTVWPDSPF